jgi:hypothetical protein
MMYLRSETLVPSIKTGVTDWPEKDHPERFYEMTTQFISKLARAVEENRQAVRTK